ncbi:hypothetical protein [Candidatus Merdisoma sp. JLR.KK006]|uniref:hypothetical protein n=1 Tax=Candidatus Merdisoma sp. JLR.KK006 TaxID=3112626 RepID=UPI002FF0C7C5
MGYHAVNEGSIMNVYWMSSCEEGSEIGKLYNGEVFTCLGITTGYQNVNEIRFRNSEGKYVQGFIDRRTSIGPLHLYGKKVTDPTLGTCYRFKTRSALTVLDNNGTIKTVLAVGDYVYSKDSTCGATNRRNFKIVGYKQAGFNVSKQDGFVTLNYEANGSMIKSNFCLYGA